MKATSALIAMTLLASGALVAPGARAQGTIDFSSTQNRFEKMDPGRTLTFKPGVPIYGMVRAERSLVSLFPHDATEMSFWVVMQVDGKTQGVETFTLKRNVVTLAGRHIVVDIVSDPNQKGLNWNWEHPKEMADLSEGTHEITIAFGSTKSSANPIAVGKFTLDLTANKELFLEMVKAIKTAEAADKED